MTESERKKELEKLFEKIDNASDRELSMIYMILAKFDPFVKYKPILPSIIRERVRKQIKKAIQEGQVVVTLQQ